MKKILSLTFVVLLIATKVQAQLFDTLKISQSSVLTFNGRIFKGNADLLNSFAVNENKIKQPKNDSIFILKMQDKKSPTDHEIVIFIRQADDTWKESGRLMYVDDVFVKNVLLNEKEIVLYLEKPGRSYTIYDSPPIRFKVISQ